MLNRHLTAFQIHKTKLTLAAFDSLYKEWHMEFSPFLMGYVIVHSSCPRKQISSSFINDPLEFLFRHRTAGWKNCYLLAMLLFISNKYHRLSGKGPDSQKRTYSFMDKYCQRVLNYQIIKTVL